MDPKQKYLNDFVVEPKPGVGIAAHTAKNIKDTDNSLKAGNRGPLLVQDLHFREKITHFDHERIPERVVHARGSGFHGTFVLHTPIPEYTTAKVLNEKGKPVPAFVRFSTVAGSRGSYDTPRDVRGFATRLYTEEGNWDIVGNNIPVFFIQDAIKFPDVIHAVKPEPHNEMPQAQTAHDNCWDFLSLTPETTHMIMWIMSDRTIPRSLRMMQGFGVHSFIFINAQGKRSFVKFHWTPKLGIHSLVWDESLKIGGQDPDFHRRDLYDAIEAGSYPEWELGIQVVPEEKADDFDFDLLDATKIIPEELVPVKNVGTLVLNRNVDEFFPEVEQVAFCTANIIPGIDHSNDPLLQGRNFSYQDTQISRLGGPNFVNLPINRPLRCPLFNNQRDGMHRVQITRSQVNYWPNRFDEAKPVKPKDGGYADAPLAVSGVKIRARGEKFDEHYNQATLFWNSMSAVEKLHIVQALSFELGHVVDRKIHERVIDQLNNVDNVLACSVADNLSLPHPSPVRKNHGQKSAFLSQVDGKHQRYTAAGLKIGVFLCDGFNKDFVLAVQNELVHAGTTCAIVGPRAGVVRSESKELQTQFSFETCRSTLFDAVLFVCGSDRTVINTNGRLIHAAREAYMHQKPIAAVGQAAEWITEVPLRGFVAGTGGSGPEVEKGVLLMKSGGVGHVKDFSRSFLSLLEKHRIWDRDVSAVGA